MIAPPVLADVMGHVAAGIALADEALVAELRGAFPEYFFTVCSQDDVPARLPPAATGSGWELYFVDAGDHCLRLTSDAEAATGLVVARCDGDED